MNRSGPILRTILGIAHLIVALVLLPAVAVFGLVTLPILLPGLIWLAALGMLLFRPQIRIRTALCVTHCILMPLAVLFVLYGFYCLQAARQSAEAGGGLLGAFGLVPIVMGALSGSLSIVSLIVAFSGALPTTTETEQSLRGDA